MHIEDRLRSFARLITQNFHLKVHFAGTIPSITTNQMFIPPLQDTPLAFQRAKFHVAHECGHDLFTVMHLKEKANEVDVRLGDILNSLEDARIERLMVEQFEGLKDEFEVNVKEILTEVEVQKIPLHQQVLHGLYLQGIGFDTDFFSNEAKAYLVKLSPLIQAAVEAKDTYDVFKVSEKILQILKNLFPPQKKKANSDDDDLPPKGFQTIPDLIGQKLEAHKIPAEDCDWDKHKFCLDGVVAENQTIKEVKQGSYSDYLRLIQPHLQQQSYLIQNIKQLFDKKRSQKRKMAFQRQRKAGMVDTRCVWKIATDDTEIFKSRRKITTTVLDLDPESLIFYLLLDMSWSMNHSDRIQYAKEAVAVLGEVLSNLEIPFSITGYTALERLSRYIFKTVDEPYTEVRTRLVNADYIGNTFTSEHIPFALRRLQQRHERKKILLVITDADGIESEYRLRRAIDHAKTEGIELIGIGICTNLMSNYFDLFIELDDLSHFATQLLALLRHVLT